MAHSDQLYLVMDRRPPAESPPSSPKILVKTVAVLPVGGLPGEEKVVEVTGALIRAFRARGFEAGFVESHRSPVPGTDPYILVAASAADPNKYCLESETTEVRRLPDNKTFKKEPIRIDRGFTNLSPGECASRFVEGVQSVLKKNNLSYPASP